MHETAQVIADALAELHKAADASRNKRVKARVDRMHRVLEDALAKHGPALGLDVNAYSGGGPKPS